MSAPNTGQPRVPLADLYTALSAVTGEIVHEVNHTLLFLRQLVSLASAGISSTQEDKDFAENEIARLERLLGNLRTFKPAVPQPEVVQVLDVVQQALAALSTRYKVPPTLAVDVPPGLKVFADKRMLLRALNNVLEHVHCSAIQNEAVGVRVVIEKNEPRTEVSLQIWDSGPELALVDRKAIFLPWKLSSRDYDHPLRLTIAHRLFRGLGWSLTYNRTVNHNEYSVLIPAAAIVVLR